MDSGHEPATKQDVERIERGVKQDIERVEQGLKQDIERVEQGLRQDIERVEQGLKQDIQMLRSEFHHAFDELNERMRDVQTELLKAFYAHAKSTDAKLNESEIADMLLRQRLTAVEFRVTEVEKRLNMPPQTQ